MEGKGFGSSLFLWRCDMIMAWVLVFVVIGLLAWSEQLLRDEDMEEDDASDNM